MDYHKESQPESTTMPSTLPEVENLILELYQPGPPQKITRIQESLHKLQRSPEGWQLANNLLASSDEKVKFFGALTYTVKLNSDSDSLGLPDARALLAQLINWLIRSADAMAGPLVVRKLCSTLVVYFLHFSALWPNCVKHLIHSFYIGMAVPLESLESSQDTMIMVQRLTPQKALAALWFCTAIAEEVGKTDANHIKTYKFHDRLEHNVSDVVALIARCLKGVSQDEPFQIKVRQEAMKCFQSWVLYSQRAFIDAGINLDGLKTLTKDALACVVMDDMFEVTVELFSDVLVNYSKFLNNEDFRLLFSLFNSEWSSERYSRLLQGDFEFESLQFGQFMLAFGDATVQDLARKSDVLSQQFLTGLAGLLNAKGYAVAEDRIFVPALEFWSTFVETMIDSLYSEEGIEAASAAVTYDSLDFAKSEQIEEGHSGTVSWFTTARSHVMQIIEYCWRKIQFPSPEEFDSWDSVDRIGFADARKDVVDLLQSSYTLTGTSLFSLFAKMTLQSLRVGAWVELEASLFCIGALSDCLDEGRCDSILAEIFRSSLFGMLADQGTQISIRTRQTALSFIGQYNGYFERHIEFLPEALTFLFRALKTPVLSVTASRSIHSLCSSCRNILTNEVEVFLQQYGEFSSSGVADPLVKERILGAIAAIIQAIPSENGKYTALSQLLRFVSIDFDNCIRLAAAGSDEEAEANGLEALRCLLSIAKGMQAPGDLPVELDYVGGSNNLKQFWTSEDGITLQSHIRTLIERIVAILPRSGDIIDAACSVFRAGFAEKLPGPFVFSPSSIASFLLKADITTVRIGTVINTACSLVSSHTAEPSERIDDTIRKLIVWLLTILQSLEGRSIFYDLLIYEPSSETPSRYISPTEQQPRNDPEIAQAGIDFVYRLLPQYVHILMDQSSALVENFFVFALRAMTGKEPLPKYAAADFWSSFMSLTNLEPRLQASINKVMAHVGPALAEALIYNISGNAARSELDKISDPLKKLVVKQVRSKPWLEAALLGKTLSGDKIGNEDRRVFLQKIIALRGAKQTNQVVRDFWLACRGSDFAYAS